MHDCRAVAKRDTNLGTVSWPLPQHVLQQEAIILCHLHMHMNMRSTSAEAHRASIEPKKASAKAISVLLGIQHMHCYEICTQHQVAMQSSAPGSARRCAQPLGAG